MFVCLLSGIVGVGGQGLEEQLLPADTNRQDSHASAGPRHGSTAATSAVQCRNGLLHHDRKRRRLSESRMPSGAQQIDALRQALTIGFANRIARRMRMHNGYRTMSENGQLAQLHPGSSHLAVDEDGLLPEWLIYHEFVATSRPFLRQVMKTAP